MTKVEENMDGPFWVKFGQDWWPCRLLKESDVPPSDKVVTRLWNRKIPASKCKVFCYGSNQASIVPTSRVRAFEEGYLKFVEQENVDGLEEALAATRASLYLEEPRIEKETCRGCNGEWSEEDLGENSTVLVCEFCEEEFHLRCTRLKVVPNGSWFCFSCRKCVPNVWKAILAADPIEEETDEESPQEVAESRKRKAKDLPSSSSKRKRGLSDEDNDEAESSVNDKNGKRVASPPIRRTGPKNSPSKHKLGKMLSPGSKEDVTEDTKLIRSTLSSCFIPKAVATKHKMKSWLSINENRWFLKLVLITERSFKDPDKFCEMLKALLESARWNEESGAWSDLLLSAKRRLNEQYRILREDSTEMRQVKFRVNEIIEELLGFCAAKAGVVSDIGTQVRVDTDALIENLERHQVSVTTDKSEFKKKVVKVMKQAKLGLFDGNGDKCNLYYVVKQQLSPEGACWPQRKPKPLSRENVFMVCSFYIGARFWFDNTVSEELRPSLETDPRSPQSRISPDKSSVASLSSVQNTKLEAVQIQKQSPTLKAESDEVKASKMSEAAAPIPQRKLASELATTASSSKIKLDTKTPKVETLDVKHEVQTESKPTKAKDDPKPEVKVETKSTPVVKPPIVKKPPATPLAAQILAHQTAETKVVPSVKKEPVHLYLRQQHDFTNEVGWYSDHLAKQVELVLESSHVDLTNSSKGASYFQCFPHSQSTVVLDYNKDPVVEDAIPVLPDEHMEHSFMQPSLSWWSVKECELDPCGDSDNDVAKTKKKFK